MDELIKKLKGIKTDKGGHENLMYGLPVYEMPNLSKIEVLFSYCDFRNNEILAPRGIVDFMFTLEGKTYTMKFSESFLLDFTMVRANEVVMNKATALFL